jgi:hypothetical protein
LDKHPQVTCIERFPCFFNGHGGCRRSGPIQRAGGKGLDLRSRSEIAMIVEELAQSQLQSVCNMTISNRSNALRWATLEGESGLLEVHRE